MASEVKTYFLSPNWDSPPPPSGPLRLGSILTHPAKPHEILNDGTQIAISDTDIVPTWKKDWERTYSQLHEGSGGVWATFLQMFGVGGDASYDHKHDFDKVYKCKMLETQTFRPKKGYIWDSLKDEEVEAYVEDTWFKRPLYMVTGLKIARGFSVETTDGKENGGELKVGVDATAFGVPVQGGPKVKILYTKHEKVAFGASSDCVFAYQLIKIQSKKNDRLSVKDHNAGALLNTDEEEEDHSIEQFDNDWLVDQKIEIEEAVEVLEQASYEDENM